MANKKTIITNVGKLTAKHQSAHDGYEYFKKVILSGESGNKCNVSVYEISQKVRLSISLSFPE